MAKFQIEGGAFIPRVRFRGRIYPVRSLVLAEDLDKQASIWDCRKSWRGTFLDDPDLDELLILAEGFVYAYRLPRWKAPKFLRVDPKFLERAEPAILPF